MIQVLNIAVLSCGLLAFAVGTADVDGRQQQKREGIQADLERYHALVDAYGKGDDDSVRQILAWNPSRLDAVVKAADTRSDVIHPWEKPRFKTAAMLHTDAAIQVVDGDKSTVESVALQLDLAGRLLQRGGPELTAFTRRWYATVTRVLRDVALLSVADRLLERGRERLPNDAVVLYESAVVQEQMASFVAFWTDAARELPPQSRGMTVSPNRPGESLRNTRLSERRGLLNSAADWLQDSIKADPSNALAHLHLGRVQMLRGNEREALRVLQSVAASQASPGASYLAVLFTGAVHERGGRLEEAARLYREACERLPANHSAYLALSHVLQRIGRGDESRAVLGRLLLRQQTSTVEPWWWYLADPPRLVRERIMALREEVRR